MASGGQTGISRRGLGKILGGAGMFAASFGATTASLAQTKKDTLTIGHISLRHLNLAIQAGNATGLPGVNLYAGLVQLDEKYQPVPYLAESWNLSPDTLTCEFKLRGDAKFHDGKPVTAEDVAFSVGVVRQFQASGMAMLGPVQKVETPDARTIVIHLSQPHPALFACLSHYTTPVLPKHVFGQGDIRQNPANLAPIGSGPFRFVEYVPDSHVVLDRFDGFFVKDRPRLRRLTFKIIKDAMSSIIAVERGDVEYLPYAGVPIRNLQRLKDNPKLVVSQKGYDILGPINFLELNLRKPPLGDVRVRKAIAYAMDKNFISEKLLLGEGKRLDSPFHSKNIFATNDLVRYELDLDKAKALLDEAGLRPKADGMRFSVTLRWYPEPGNINSQGPVAQYLKAQLRKVGIDVQLVPSPDFATFANAIGNWEYDMTLNGTWNQVDPTLGVSRAFMSDNQRKGVMYTNTGGYANPRVDALLVMAAKEPDVAKRKAQYAEFAKIISDELPVIHTNEEPLYSIYSADLVGLPTAGWGVLSPLTETHWK